MARKHIYLMGILITILAGIFLYLQHCSCCNTPDTEEVVVTHKTIEQQ